MEHERIQSFGRSVSDESAPPPARITLHITNWSFPPYHGSKVCARASSRYEIRRETSWIISPITFATFRYTESFLFIFFSTECPLPPPQVAVTCDLPRHICIRECAHVVRRRSPVNRKHVCSTVASLLITVKLLLMPTVFYNCAR